MQNVTVKNLDKKNLQNRKTSRVKKAFSEPGKAHRRPSADPTTGERAYIRLRKAPFHRLKEAISACEKGYIGTRKRLFRNTGRGPRDRRKMQTADRQPLAQTSQNSRICGRNVFSGKQRHSREVERETGARHIRFFRIIIQKPHRTATRHSFRPQTGQVAAWHKEF